MGRARRAGRHLRAPGRHSASQSVQGAEFQAVDLPSIQAAVAAAVAADVRHFVYVSVAHPAPMMHDYIAVRTEGEELVREHGLNATILRPWYILGQGHWWPYALCRSMPSRGGCHPCARARCDWGW